MKKEYHSGFVEGKREAFEEALAMLPEEAIIKDSDSRFTIDQKLGSNYALALMRERLFSKIKSDTRL